MLAMMPPAILLWLTNGFRIPKGPRRKSTAVRSKRSPISSIAYKIPIECDDFTIQSLLSSGISRGYVFFLPEGIQNAIYNFKPL